MRRTQHASGSDCHSGGRGAIGGGPDGDAAGFARSGTSRPAHIQVPERDYSAERRSLSLTGIALIQAGKHAWECDAGKAKSDMSKTIDVTELVLRDAHQSLMATRMAMEDMVPACADLDQAGYWSVECWGGATFDSCIRFLNEDPWERLRQFRKLLPNTPAADAAARAEPAGLPALRRYRGGPLRGEGGGERDGRVPRVRRAERHPQSAALDRRGAAHRKARAGHHLLHGQPAAHARRFRGDGGKAAGPGLRFDLHQGHGRAAQAATGLRHRQGHQGNLRARTCAFTCTCTPPPESPWSAS